MMPVPRLVSPPEPLIAPLKVVSLLLAPVVSRPLPSTTLPAPSNAATTWLLLARLNVAPDDTRTTVPVGITFVTPVRNMPLLM